MPPLPPVTSAAFPFRSKRFILTIMQYLPKASDAAMQVDAVRRFNRFYTRRIGALQPQYLGSPYSLPQARVLYELGQRARVHRERARRATSISTWATSAGWCRA